MLGAKKIKVDVIVVRDTTKPGDVWFELGYGHVSGQKLKFRNKNHPGFDVHFEIVDDIHSGCTFLPNLQDVMWVQTINPTPPYPCPTVPAYWPEFEATGYDNNNNYTTLVVRNCNDTPTFFSFTLRFNKPGWPTPIDYDPIGDNQDGPRYFSMLKLVIAGLLACAAAFVAVEIFFDPGFIN